MNQGKSVCQLLAQWEHQSAADATWEFEHDLQQRFPDISLEDKAHIGELANVPIDQVKGSTKFGRNVECDEEGTEINPRRSDRTGRISTRVTKFRDFVMG